MFDYSKLKGLIVEKYGTQGIFAKCIHRSQGYISSVLNGNMYLKADEIEIWRNALGINVDDIGLYFFAKKVDNK